MGKDMGLEHSSTVKEENMWEIGNKIRCMGKVSYITPVRKQLMKENGKMINFQAMVCFSINKLLL